MVSFFAEVNIFRFWPKTMDYNKDWTDQIRCHVDHSELAVQRTLQISLKGGRDDTVLKDEGMDGVHVPSNEGAHRGSGINVSRANLRTAFPTGHEGLVERSRQEHPGKPVSGEVPDVVADHYQEVSGKARDALGIINGVVNPLQSQQVVG